MVEKRRAVLARVTVLLAVLVLIGSTAPTGAVAAGSHTSSGSDTSVFVVGDSITRMGTPALRARGLHWEVDAAGGRKVTSLGWVLTDRLERGVAPRVVVVALGADAKPGWDAVTGYRKALDQLPATTTVVFVSVYRDRAYYTPWVAKRRPDWNPTFAVTYTRAMYQIAAERAYTCVAPWRPWARAHRANLTSGVHPHGRGRVAWARIVAEAVAACR